MGTFGSTKADKVSRIVGTVTVVVFLIIAKVVMS